MAETYFRMTKSRECESCKASFEYEAIVVSDREMFVPRLCGPCVDAQHDQAKRDEIESGRVRRLEAWYKVCPPLYRDTDEKRLPEPFRVCVSRWSYGPKGLGFVGSAGKGKTRAAFRLLYHNMLDKRKVDAISATRFAMACADQFSDSRERKQIAFERIEQLKSVDILLLDDLGKAKMTERAELELFDLLEHRTSNLLPTIWTSNALGNAFLSMMSQDRGEPILRRLKEFSEIVSI